MQFDKEFPVFVYKTRTNQYQVEITVTVQTASTIKKIYSPTHNIDVNHNVGDNVC